jgi:hypothetical protein
MFCSIDVLFNRRRETLNAVVGTGLRESVEYVARTGVPAIGDGTIF